MILTHSYAADVSSGGPTEILGSDRSQYEIRLEVKMKKILTLLLLLCSVNLNADTLKLNLTLVEVDHVIDYGLWDRMDEPYRSTIEFDNKNSNTMRIVTLNYSMHFSGYDYNNQHNGIGFEYGGIGVIHYTNSYNDPSNLIYHYTELDQYPILEKLESSFLIGTATGYEETLLYMGMSFHIGPIRIMVNPAVITVGLAIKI